ncbi:MAG: hypothetical protein L3J96_02885, partial [Thermoplasmata archaeon]|nr:hypothetical protein [Thermoplasmata archaeon]
MQPDDLSRTLGPKLGEKLLGVDPYPGTAGKVRFAREGAVGLFHEMRDSLGFTHLSMVAGIDWVDHR